MIYERKRAKQKMCVDVKAQSSCYSTDMRTRMHIKNLKLV